MRVVAAHDKDRGALIAELVAARDVVAGARDGLVEVRTVLQDLGAGGFQDDLALGSESEAVSAIEPEGDGGRIGAGGDDEIELELALVVVINEVDAGINGVEPDLGEGGNIGLPRGRIVAEEIIHAPGESILAFAGGAFVGAQEAQAEETSLVCGGIGEREDGLVGGEVNAMVPAAGDELETRVGLAAIGLEIGGELAEGGQGVDGWMCGRGQERNQEQQEGAPTERRCREKTGSTEPHFLSSFLSVLGRSVGALALRSLMTAAVRSSWPLV